MRSILIYLYVCADCIYIALTIAHAIRNFKENLSGLIQKTEDQICRKRLHTYLRLRNAVGERPLFIREKKREKL